MAKFTIRDPFAGFSEIEGKTIKDAVAKAYRNVPVEERPTYVIYWNWTGVSDRVDVPKGKRRPPDDFPKF